MTNAELSKSVRAFTAGALDKMLAYNWPGNVRQLRSVVRRAVLIAEDCIEEQHLGIERELEVKTPGSDAWPAAALENNFDNLSLREIVKRSSEKVERQVLELTLRRTNGNKAKAARRLRIDYKTLHTKIKEYGIVIHAGGKSV